MCRRRYDFDRVQLLMPVARQHHRQSCGRKLRRAKPFGGAGVGQIEVSQSHPSRRVAIGPSRSSGSAEPSSRTRNAHTNPARRRSLEVRAGPGRSRITEGPWTFQRDMRFHGTLRYHGIHLRSSSPARPSRSRPSGRHSREGTRFLNLRKTRDDGMTDEACREPTLWTPSDVTKRSRGFRTRPAGS